MCICIAVNKLKSSDVVVISVIFSTHIGAEAIVGSVEQIYKLGCFCNSLIMSVIFLVTDGQDIW